MLKIFGLIVLLLISNCVAVELKCAIHCHTNLLGDDGANSVLELEQAYKAAGYDVLFLTPHNESYMIMNYQAPKVENMTVVFGWESFTLWPWHELVVGNVTVLAHPGGNCFGRPNTTLVEVVNNGALHDFPFRTNGIAGEDTHNLKSRIGRTWFELNATDRSPEAVLKAFEEAAKKGNIKWGFRHKDFNWRGH